MLLVPVKLGCKPRTCLSGRCHDDVLSGKRAAANPHLQPPNLSGNVATGDVIFQPETAPAAAAPRRKPEEEQNGSVPGPLRNTAALWEPAGSGRGKVR